MKRAYVISVNEGVLASTLTSSSFNQYIFRGRMTLMQEVSAVELGYARASSFNRSISIVSSPTNEKSP